MALCLTDPKHGYYMNRDPLGARGDFITAPEISQVFGEIVGLWAVSTWQKMGEPAPLRLIELGPGRGTLLDDGLRAAAAVSPAFVAAVAVHLIELSPVLRGLQARRLSARHPGAIAWHQSLAEVPAGPAIVIGNEFLDALPIRQLVFGDGVWRERMVGSDGRDGLAFELGDVAEFAGHAPACPGDVAEIRSGEDAILAASRAYESNPESNDYARNLIGILRVAGPGGEELRVYRRLMKSSASPALMVGYGSALVRAGDHVEAIKILSEYVALDPSNASAVGLLAVAQRRANQRSAAVETLKAGVSKADEGARLDLALELAQTYEEAGRNEEAIAQYEKVFEELLTKAAQSPADTPLFGEVVNRLVRLLRRSGSEAKLQGVLAKTRRALDERNPLLDLITVESLREDGKLREALELARAASRRRPDDRALKFTEAVILGESKLFKESADLLRSMIKGDAESATEDAGVYIVLSGLQMQAGRLDEAEESARKALELNPDDAQALIQLSSILDRAGKHEASEKALRELLKREPDNATALNNLGYFMVERGVGYEEALKLIEQAVAIDPTQGSFLDSLGWTHFKLGNIEKARQYLEKATIYSRRNSTIHEHLGDVLREAGRLADARKQWEKALEYSIEADEIARLRGKLKDAR